MATNGEEAKRGDHLPQQKTSTTEDRQPAGNVNVTAAAEKAQTANVESNNPDAGHVQSFDIDRQSEKMDASKVEEPPTSERKPQESKVKPAETVTKMPVTTTQQPVISLPIGGLDKLESKTMGSEKAANENNTFITKENTTDVKEVTSQPEKTAIKDNEIKPMEETDLGKKDESEKKETVAEDKASRESEKPQTEKIEEERVKRLEKEKKVKAHDGGKVEKMEVDEEERVEKMDVDAPEKKAVDEPDAKSTDDTTKLTKSTVVEKIEKRTTKGAERRAKAATKEKPSVKAEKDEDVPMVGTKRKRGRPVEAGKTVAKAPAEAKKAKLEHAEKKAAESGVVLALGQGDTGQLGLGEDILERSKPAIVKEIDDSFVSVCAGGMHTLCLNSEGEVFSFGCNDEGALGRETPEDSECFLPKKVNLPEKVSQISSGDSHSVALTEEGKVYIWGTFRDSSGSFGLTPKGQIEKTPIPLAHNLNVVKIASGSDHVLMLTSNGEVFSIGCAEQGQLGRVGERFVARGGRRGLDLLLVPDKVHAKNRRIVFVDIWAGSYSSYALTADNKVYVCGLNNYHQLGIAKGQMFFTLVESTSLSKIVQEHGLKEIKPGQHHTLVLDKSGNVYALGRVEYGRLGLGEEVKQDAKVPTKVDLPVCKNISCGTAVSFAVAETGEAFSWGMGTNGQLGHQEEEDSWKPMPIIGKQLETRAVLEVSGGGQHTVLLAKNK